MPQFTYDDIKKKIIKRERYKIKIENFNTLFRILKETSDYSFNKGHKRFVRLVSFRGTLPCLSNTVRGYSDIHYVYGKNYGYIKMLLQAITKIDEYNVPSSNWYTVLQKPPMSYLKSTEISGNDTTNQIVANTGFGIIGNNITMTPETVQKVLPFIDSTALTSVIPNDRYIFRMVDTIPTNVPIYDSDNYSSNYTNAINELDTINTSSFPVTSYEFYYTSPLQANRGPRQASRLSKTATTKTFNYHTVFFLQYTDDSDNDTQMLTEIPLISEMLNISFYQQQTRDRPEDLTTSYSNALIQTAPTAFTSTTVMPGREFYEKKLNFDRYSLFDYDDGPVDYNVSSYIAGAVNENKNDLTTMKQDTFKIYFFVVLEVLLVDMKPSKK